MDVKNPLKGADEDLRWLLVRSHAFNIMWIAEVFSLTSLSKRGRNADMDLVEVRGFALSLPGATEDCPFGDETLVFRVGDKIFALISLEGEPIGLSLKCDPSLSERLRENYPQIVPGYHMNKKHWITISDCRSLPGELVQRQICHSYMCVLKKLPKGVRMGIMSSFSDREWRCFDA
jgi:hypothetical protein